VLHAFGGDTLAVLVSGGASGKRLEGLLAGQGFSVAGGPIRNEIRTNLTITDQHCLTVNLNEPGPPIGKLRIAAGVRVIRQALKSASWLMVCGSIPPGVPATFYARLITMARVRKVRTLLDCDGSALREGIEARPTVVAPNQQEAERLLGRTLLTRTHWLEAA